MSTADAYDSMLKTLTDAKTQAFKHGFIDGLTSLDLTLDTLDRDLPDINRTQLVALLRQWADETRTQIRAGIQ